MATLGSLVVEIGANVGKLQTDMARAVSVVDRASSGIKRAATVAAGAIAAIGAGVSLSAITGAARQVIDLGDKLRDLSFATGQSVEQLSFLEFAAGQSGTSLDTIASAAQRLSRNLIDVANGGGENAARALRRLGISATELARVDLVSQFQQLGDALRDVQNPSERAAFGAALLGKQFRELAPLILDNEEGFGRLVDRFIELNGVISGGQADQFDAFNDALGELQLASRGAAEAIATSLAPAFTDLFQSVASTIPNIVPFFTDSFFAINEILLDASRAIQRSKLDFLEFFDGLGNTAITAKMDATKAKIKAITDEITALRDARDGAILSRADQRQTERRAIGRAIPAGNIEVDPEAQGKKAEAAARAAERVADALQRESDSVRAFLQDYSREREQDFQREVEQSRQRIESLRQSVATPRERAVAELAEFERVFGSDSEEYGRKAVEVFTELEDTVSTLDESGQRAATTFADLGATFSSAFEEAIFSASSFSDVLSGLGQDIARLLLRQTVTDPIAEFFQDSFKKGGIGGGIGSFFSSIFGGFRASGGPVSAGRAYVVGERGPELLIPGTAGTVVPNGGGVQVTVNNFSNEPVRTEDNGTRGIDVFVGSSVSRAAARGMMAPLGIRPPLVAR